MNIVLTGFMATGKSQIGLCLSQRTGYKLIDTDKLIEKKENMSVNEIFANHGESYFRQVEADIIKEVSKLENTIISTGGGVVLNKENIANLRKSGVIVNLSCDFKVIEDRLCNAATTRPLMQNRSVDETRALFNSRKPFYDDCDYKITISNDLSPNEHAQMILNKLNTAKGV
ncbi:MAG: shikimate kinase [Clostridia bacterium]|nr:shikimate kinase [Clostridia bacterium]